MTMYTALSSDGGLNMKLRGEGAGKEKALAGERN